MAVSRTNEEIEQSVGEKVRSLRLMRNLDQATVAERSGISVRALRNLEQGAGSTVRTLLSVMRALGREAWFDAMAPVATINPLNLPLKSSQRHRATSTRLKQAQETSRMLVVRECRRPVIK